MRYIGDAMQVGVGYSDNADTEAAGIEAAKQAIAQANRDDPCDLILLFSTAYHEPRYLQSVVSSVLGIGAIVIGGGAIGTISNHSFGYAGEQIGLAAFWLHDAGFQLFSKGGLAENEENVGFRLGNKMAESGVRVDTPSLLFYDAIDRTRDGVLRMNMATPLLAGLEKGLGFLPNTLIGAGLQGDYDSTPTMQWIGAETPKQQQAMVLTFSGGVQIDSAIMHGCRPFGNYYTITKSEGQTILEIDGQPALPFIASQMQPALPVDEFPFFMIFGINSDPGSMFSEKNYSNRLCLAIDKKRNGIVMFEPDMVPGTKFQIMYRSLNHGYIPPAIEHVFQKNAHRRPVMALYIDCAGRAANFGGEVEDAVVVQNVVADRVPLLGIYSGVEIAPVMGMPRPLDWTGVFCLFSMPK